MRFLIRVLITTVSVWPQLVAAQRAQLPYDLHRTEPDQELNLYAYQYGDIHRVSPQLRGVRGAGNTIYWVSTNGRQLTAYQRGR